MPISIVVRVDVKTFWACSYLLPFSPSVEDSLVAIISARRINELVDLKMGLSSAVMKGVVKIQSLVSAQVLSRKSWDILLLVFFSRQTLYTWFKKSCIVLLGKNQIVSEGLSFYLTFLTLSRWIVTTIKLHYKQTGLSCLFHVHTHLTKTQFSSAVFLKEVPRKIFVRQQTWSSEDTFCKHRALELLLGETQKLEKLFSNYYFSESNTLHLLVNSLLESWCGDHTED